MLPSRTMAVPSRPSQLPQPGRVSVAEGRRRATHAPKFKLTRMPATRPKRPQFCTALSDRYPNTAAVSRPNGSPPKRRTSITAIAAHRKTSTDKAGDGEPGNGSPMSPISRLKRRWSWSQTVHAAMPMPATSASVAAERDRGASRHAPKTPATTCSIGTNFPTLRSHGGRPAEVRVMTRIAKRATRTARMANQACDERNGEVDESDRVSLDLSESCRAASQRAGTTKLRGSSNSKKFNTQKNQALATVSGGARDATFRALKHSPMMSL